MPYTDSDLTAVRAALLRGERTVVFADRQVTYRDVADLLLVEQRILSELSTTVQTRPRQTLAVAEKGF